MSRRFKPSQDLFEEHAPNNSGFQNSKQENSNFIDKWCTTLCKKNYDNVLKIAQEITFLLIRNLYKSLNED